MATNMAREDTLMSLFSLFGAPGEFETIGLPPEATEGAEDFLGTGPAFFPTLLTSVVTVHRYQKRHSLPGTIAGDRTVCPVPL